MKALVYTDLQKMEYKTDYPVPNEEFLVRVMGCGVCGTDLKTYLKGHAYFQPPCVLGHEFYGEVIKTPEGLGYKNGDLVVVAPYFGCGECALCEKEAGSLCQNQSYVDYGAFAEVVPGVDGLIHISQIANRRIGKPEDVLSVGDVVEAKITAIDEEKHKISLSIRALSEPAPAAEEEEAADEE